MESEDRDAWARQHERRGLWILAAVLLLGMFSAGWFGRGWLHPAGKIETAPLCQAVIMNGGQAGDMVSVGPGSLVSVEVRCPGEAQIVDLVAGDAMEIVTVLGMVQESGVWVWRFAVPPEMIPGEYRFFPYADGRPAGRMLTMQLNPPGKGEGK